jgi:hypothetical protein
MGVATLLLGSCGDDRQSPIASFRDSVFHGTYDLRINEGDADQISGRVEWQRMGMDQFRIDVDLHDGDRTAMISAIRSGDVAVVCSDHSSDTDPTGVCLDAGEFVNVFSPHWSMFVFFAQADRVAPGLQVAGFDSTCVSSGPGEEDCFSSSGAVLYSNSIAANAIGLLASMQVVDSRLIGAAERIGTAELEVVELRDRVLPETFVPPYDVVPLVGIEGVSD